MASKTPISGRDRSQCRRLSDANFPRDRYPEKEPYSGALIFLASDEALSRHRPKTLVVRGAGQLNTLNAPRLIRL